MSTTLSIATFKVLENRNTLHQILYQTTLSDVKCDQHPTQHDTQCHNIRLGVNTARTVSLVDYGRNGADLHNLSQIYPLS